MTQTQRITLLDSLAGEMLQLPYAAMCDVGPAVQTLAGLLRITRRETYSPISDIAELARVPLRTARKHLARLAAGGWIVNAGRGHTRKGAPRRTCTIRITKKTLDALAAPGKGADSKTLRYGLLPCWACKNHSWGTRALLSVIIARMAGLKSKISPDSGRDEIDADDYWDALENMGGELNFQFSLADLKKITGLSKSALIAAKASLRKSGIVQHSARQLENGGDDSDLLFPNREFGIVVTPASTPGKCSLKYEKGAA